MLRYKHAVVFILHDYTRFLLFAADDGKSRIRPFASFGFLSSNEVIVSRAASKRGSRKNVIFQSQRRPTPRHRSMTLLLTKIASESFLIKLLGTAGIF